MPRAMSYFLYSAGYGNDQCYKGKKVDGMLTVFCLAFFGQFSFKLLFFSKEDRVKRTHFFLARPQESEALSSI
jgi:hypothetical protein